MSDSTIIIERWRALFPKLLFFERQVLPSCPPRLDTNELELVYRCALRHDVLGQVSRNFMDLLGEDFQDEQKDRFRDGFAAQILRNLQLANECRRVTALLAGSGIPVIPYKGTALAERYYSDPALRASSDLDLLVPAGSVLQAVDLLLRDGYTYGADNPDPRDWHLIQTMHNDLVVIAPSCAWCVEIHWQLFKPWRQMSFDLDPHWWKFNLSSGEGLVGCLHNEEMLLVVCAHAMNHYWDKLKWVVDVDRIVRSRPLLDWQQLLVRARQSGLRRALFVGLLLAQQTLATPLPIEISESLQSDRLSGRICRICSRGWFAVPGIERSWLWKAVYLVLSRERLRDKLLMGFCRPIHAMAMKLARLA